MLGFLFGFYAQLSRLQYFLYTIALAVVMTAICFSIAGYAFKNTPKGMPVSLDTMTWPVMALAIVFAFATFTLQSMRFRNIGWDPVCVIPRWIALLIVDYIVATKIPAWSLGREHQGTIVGAVVNLGLFMALLFWPGAEYEASPPPLRDSWKPDAPSRGRGAASPAADRIVRVANGEFGRRAG
jgi:hypothetical protein